MEEQKLESKVYTTQEVMQLLHISSDKLYWMVKKKMIRPLAWQKSPFLFPKTEIDRVLKDMVSPSYTVLKEKEEINV